MRIIYHCYGQAHSSVTAANIHLGHLPRHRRATVAEIQHQPCFDRTEAHQLGRPCLMGTDEWGHQVYVLGLAGGRLAMVRAVQEFLVAGGVDPAAFLFVNALQHAGVPLRIGGYTSRRLGLIWPGRPLSALGVYLKYPRFVALVDQVRQQVQGRLP
ncbi:MAG: DUF3189 family protein [Bacillota bacterium]